MIDFDKPRTGRPDTLMAAPKRPDRNRTAGPTNALVFDEVALEAPQDVGISHTQTGRRINDVAAIALVALLALAPIPLASARPVFWMIWSVMALVALAVYMVAMAVAEPRRKMTIGQIWPVWLPLLILIGFGMVQYVLSQTGLTTELGGIEVPIGTLAPDATLLGVLRLCGLLALFVLAVEVSSRAQRVNAMGWAILWLVLLNAIWSIIALVMLDDYVFWGEKFAYQGVATGTFVNRNSFASFLGMGLVVGICLILARAHRPHVRHPGGSGLLSEKNIELGTLWALVAIIFVALLLTESRMGTVAGGVAGLFAYVVMGLKHHEQVSTVLLRAGVVVLVATMIAAGGFGIALLERGVLSSTDAEIRTDLYLQIADMIRNAPLLGSGLDSFMAGYEIVQAPPVSGDVTWRLAHSTYLTWWSEAGLLFGSLPIVSGLAAAVILVGMIRRRRTNYAVAVAGLATLLLLALHSIVDFSFEIQANVMFLAVILGLALGKLRRKAGAPE